VPFALGTVTLLFVLAGLRQIAAVAETRRLYRQVELVSDERQRLMSQLLERNLHDRHSFAAQLYEQAVAAYTSFTLLAGTGDAPTDPTSAMAKATAMVGGDLARHAESVRELVQAIRPLDGATGPGPGRGTGGPPSERLGIPMRAYLASTYGDHPAPRLSVEMSDDLALDWISETVLLQIAQEALHNVWRHSNATRVDIVIEADDGPEAETPARPGPERPGARGGKLGTAAQDATDRPRVPSVAMCVADDGIGFDLASVPEGSGIAVMRASAAVVGGTLVVDSHVGFGTAVTARLVPGGPPAPAAPPEPPAPRALRLVRGGSPDA
jgi:glucose-6-phosphate-specific signal transduction histidine kinase